MVSLYAYYAHAMHPKRGRHASIFRSLCSFFFCWKAYRPCTTWWRCASSLRRYITVLLASLCQNYGLCQHSTNWRAHKVTMGYSWPPPPLLWRLNLSKSTRTNFFNLPKGSFNYPSAGQLNLVLEYIAKMAIGLSWPAVLMTNDWKVIQTNDLCLVQYM